jgi:hypothetical protein
MNGRSWQCWRSVRLECQEAAFFSEPDCWALGGARRAAGTRNEQHHRTASLNAATVGTERLRTFKHLTLERMRRAHRGPCTERRELGAYDCNHAARAAHRVRRSPAKRGAGGAAELEVSAPNGIATIVRHMAISAFGCGFCVLRTVRRLAVLDNRSEEKEESSCRDFPYRFKIQIQIQCHLGTNPHLASTSSRRSRAKPDRSESLLATARSKRTRRS